MGKVDGRFHLLGNDERSRFGVAGKNPVVAGEVLPLRWHEGGDALKEFHGKRLQVLGSTLRARPDAENDAVNSKGGSSL